MKHVILVNLTAFVTGMLMLLLFYFAIIGLFPAAAGLTTMLVLWPITGILNTVMILQLQKRKII
jgi:hypothetical protein